jgi:hypothetical protein
MAWAVSCRTCRAQDCLVRQRGNGREEVSAAQAEVSSTGDADAPRHVAGAH